MALWYVIFNGEQVGPMERTELTKYSLTPDTMVWREGLQDWMPAGQMPELSDLLYGHSSTQPPHPNAFRQGYNEGYREGAQYGYNDNRYPKSKVAAGVLAIILGGLGIQYFYVGKVGAGFLTILLTLVTCGAWEIITFIQGILMLTMSDEEFNRKYVFTNKTFPLF